MRLMIVLVLSLIAASCGKAAYVDPTSPRFLYQGLRDLPGRHRDADLQAILDEFIHDATQHGLDPWKQERHLRVIDFHEGLALGKEPPIDGAHAEGSAPSGICVTAREVNPVNKKSIGVHHFIYIDASFKDFIGTPYLKAIAFHEFFHCLFEGQHTAALDLKSIRTPMQRMTDQIKATSLDAELTTDQRVALYRESRQQYFDEVAEKHDIMAPGLLNDTRFWDNKWDEMVEKLFAQ